MKFLDILIAFALLPWLGPGGERPIEGTALLDWKDQDISVRLMDAAHAFVEGEISKSVRRLASRWNRDTSTTIAYAKSVESNRERFRRMIGVVEDRLPPRLEFFSERGESRRFDGAAPVGSLVAETEEFEIHQVRWDVIDGLVAEGLYVVPKSSLKLGAPTVPGVVLIPDADNTPEDIMGITGKLPSNQQIGLRFATAGFRMLIPATINRARYLGPDGKDARLKRADQTHREWIYRQAFQLGRHVIGYEVQTALAAADWLRSNGLGTSVSVAGYGEGGMVAFYAAAADEKINAAFVSGYFSPRDSVWSEPIYRNVFGLLREFGDAEIASLIWPRDLLIEHTEFPHVSQQKGAITTPATEKVVAEIDRVGTLLGTLSPPPRILFSEAKDGARAGYSAMAAFAAAIDFQEAKISRVSPMALLLDKREGFDPASRHERIFRQMEAQVQKLVRQADGVREKRFFQTAEPGLIPGKWSTLKRHPILDPANFIEKSKAFREEFRREVIGEFDETLLPLNPRTRKIIENEKWTAWEVVLDVYPGFFAWGDLLIPKDLKPGEKRPVVVCQHGRNGVPRDTIDAHKTAYNDFAAHLAERGFITFAPHNLYRHEDRYRWLDRKANTIGCTLFSFIVPSHQQILRWLKTLPQVDGDHIGFYGLSYGGESAVRIPSLLTDYCLSICSGDFNQWTRKVADVDFPNGFMKSIEWEMPYWNMGNTFDYAEMAALIFPRPFMVERGHHDAVSTDPWVAYEYAKVRWLYAQFGLADQTEIEFFQGGHSINEQGTYDFLHRHLGWQKP